MTTPAPGVHAPAAPGAPDAARAITAAGAAVFEWREDADHLQWAGAAEALGLDVATDWAGLRALFVEADRERIDALRMRGGVTVARIGRGGGGAFLRVRVRAGWSDGGERIFGGLVSPAFGAAGEADEHGKLGFEPALRRAAEALEFEAWYQPIVSLRDGAVVGAEALVRWDCPGRGILPPDDFLPLLDDIGALPRLGGWMRAAAAEALAGWRAGAGARAPDYVSVNVTARELEDDGLPERIAGVIARHGLASGALRLEITENEVMRDPDRAARVLGEVKTAGASLALDDFGSGHASLAWLERFPVDALKIDRYFVRTLPSSDSSAAIVESVAGLAHTLGLSVIAEGVEDAGVAARLADVGCDYGQGFHFAPALTETEFERLF